MIDIDKLKYNYEGPIVKLINGLKRTEVDPGIFDYYDSNGMLYLFESIADNDLGMSVRFETFLLKEYHLNLQHERVEFLTYIMKKRYNKTFLNIY